MGTVSYGKLYKLIIAVIFLNVFDMTATIYWCQTAGVDIEANPLLHWFLAFNPVLAIAFKAFCVLLFAILLLIASRSDLKLACRCASLALFIYVLTGVWHLVPIIQQLLT